MFLRQLRLTNVRSIKELEIDFSAADDPKKLRQWTLLLAENGTGKSCVLRSTGLLLAGWDTLLKLMTDIDGWIRNGARQARMEAVIETKKGEQKSLSLTLKRGMKLQDFSRLNEKGIAPLEVAMGYPLRNYFVVGYGASRRLPSGLSNLPTSQQSQFLPPRGQAMASLFSADAVMNSLQSWAMDLDYQRGDEGLAILRSAVKTLLPGVDFGRIDKSRKELLFNTQDGQVPLSRLSDGYQNMAGWIGDLLYRITQSFADLKKPLEARGLLLLDEMDLHLHPVWQRQLMAFLTASLPNFQIIATTHSPMTAQQAGPEELHLLERPSPKASPILRRFDGSPRLMRLEDLAVSPWFGLQSHYSLVVEKLRAKHDSTKHRATKPRQKSAGLRSRASKAAPTSIFVSQAGAELSSLPIFNPRTEIERQNHVLLKKVEAAVMKQANGRSVPARRAQGRRSPRKAK